LLKRSLSRNLVIAGTCGLAILPFFCWGTPSGHDIDFHLSSWMEVLSQWKQGIVLPRWAALAHWGYGEARFLFYPPASWSLGASLGAILPWKMVAGAYCWIVLALAGVSMYALARRWLRPSDALFAAAFYAVNPYHLLIVYWRSAFAELMSAILVPLVLLCVLRIRESGLRPVLWLSLPLAAAWLTNAPAALMIHYSAAALACLIAVQQKSPRPLIRTALAALLGAGLASFFLLPAIYEQHWINIAQVLSPGVMPQDNFLFTPTQDSDHNRFNFLISLVAIAEIAVTAFSMWLARKRLDRPTWLLLSAWVTASAFVMLSVSNFLWQYLPEFRFVQLPFRWLLCLNVPLALLLTAATVPGLANSKRPADSAPDDAPDEPATASTAPAPWAFRATVCALLLVVLLVAGHRIQPPWWDTSADIEEISDAISNGTGYEGTDEYTPADADPYELNKDLPPVSDPNGADAHARILEWGATHRHFTVGADAPEEVTIRLFNYPAWKVTVNGRAVATESSEVTHLLVIPLSPGENDVCIDFARTPDRLAGGVLSLIALAIFAAAWINTRPPQLHAANPAARFKEADA
jgi:hypothetical protein